MKKTMFKISTLIAALVILLSFRIVYAKADYSESSQVLTSLGIFEGQPSEDELEQKIVSRIDALNMALKLSGATVTAIEDAQVIFSDVPANSAYFFTIATANKLGIVKTTDFVNFAPTNPISTDEFARMIIRALGYDFKAAKYNYSLSGYTRLAMEMDIIENGDISDDGYISLGQAGNALYNALFSAPTVSYIANGNAETYVDSESTVLEAVFGYSSCEGIYTANAYTSLYGTFDLSGNEFVVTELYGLYRL